MVTRGTLISSLSVDQEHVVETCLLISGLASCQALSHDGCLSVP